MIVLKTTVYTIDEHPNRTAVYNWVRNNWHDLMDHAINDLIQSLEKLATAVGGELDYGISAYPNQGERISIKGYNMDLLEMLVNTADDYPLTGVCYDQDVILALFRKDFKPVLEMIHSETEYRYSDEGLYEHLMANEYEFTTEGEISPAK